MESPEFRQAVHVDPNNDPWLYENLDIFALLFDKISVWSFSPNLFERFNRRLTARQFLELVVARPSPYILGGRDTWFRPGTPQRIRPLQEWVEAFDAPLVRRLRGEGGIFEYAASPQAVRIAWDAAAGLCEDARAVLGKDIQGQELAGADVSRPEERVIGAYRAANAALAADRAIWDSLPGTREEKVVQAFQERFRLPVIFQQTSDSEYSRNLASLGPLPCLYYEHFTKAQMIAALEQHCRRTGMPAVAFSMFLFGDWHRLMASGIGPLSNLDRLRTDYPQLDLFLRREGVSEPTDAVRALLTTLTAPELDREAFGATYAQGLIEWHRNDGPRFLRELARDVWRRSKTNAPQTWAEDVHRKLRAGAKRFLRQEKVVKSVDAFVPRMAAALGVVISLWFEFGPPERLLSSNPERVLKVLLEKGTEETSAGLTQRLLETFKKVCLGHDVRNPYFLWYQLDEFGSGGMKREEADRRG